MVNFFGIRLRGQLKELNSTKICRSNKKKGILFLERGRVGLRMYYVILKKNSLNLVVLHIVQAKF